MAIGKKNDDKYIYSHVHYFYCITSKPRVNKLSIILVIYYIWSLSHYLCCSF